MTTFFDVSRLTAEQIGELTRKGHGLKSFKNELVNIAREIPDIPNEVEREKRLKAAAVQVIENWNKYKKSLPKYALDVIVSGLNDIKPPDIVMAL